MEGRLARINEALGSRVTTPAGPEARPVTAAPRRGGKRLANSMSLVEAMRKATSVKPLTKPEILAAIKKLGYQFESSNPMNSVNVKLYTRGLFTKKPGGRFLATKQAA